MASTPYSLRLDALRAHVPDLGVTEIAGLSGLKVGHVSQVLAGKKGIGWDPGKALARVFGCSVAWLLDGDGGPPGARTVRRAVAAARSAHVAPGE